MSQHLSVVIVFFAAALNPALRHLPAQVTSYDGSVLISSARVDAGPASSTTGGVTVRGPYAPSPTIWTVFGLDPELTGAGASGVPVGANCVDVYQGNPASGFNNTIVLGGITNTAAGPPHDSLEAWSVPLSGPPGFVSIDLSSLSPGIYQITGVACRPGSQDCLATTAGFGWNMTGGFVQWFQFNVETGSASIPDIAGSPPPGEPNCVAWNEDGNRCFIGYWETPTQSWIQEYDFSNAQMGVPVGQPASIPAGITDLTVAGSAGDLAVVYASTLGGDGLYQAIFSFLNPVVSGIPVPGLGNSINSVDFVRETLELMVGISNLDTTCPDCVVRVDLSTQSVVGTVHDPSLTGHGGALTGVDYVSSAYLGTDVAAVPAERLRFGFDANLAFDEHVPYAGNQGYEIEIEAPMPWLQAFVGVGDSPVAVPVNLNYATASLWLNPLAPGSTIIPLPPASEVRFNAPLPPSLAGFSVVLQAIAAFSSGNVSLTRGLHVTVF